MTTARVAESDRSLSSGQRIAVYEQSRAGIYGMNFENMPELSTPTGYFVGIAIMVVIAVSQIICFRYKGCV